MSQYLGDLPDLPRNVGGQALPDFINAKILERGVTFPMTEPDKFDLNIKKSPLFGGQDGVAFDEGAKWFPLKTVHFTHTEGGITSYRAQYRERSTGTYGSRAEHHHHKRIHMDEDEHITGIAGTYKNVVTGLTIRTTKKTVQFGQGDGIPFKFDIPYDHKVVGFYGLASNKINAIGVSYIRKLETITAGTPNLPGAPTLTSQTANIFLDDDTRRQWAANNLAAIEAKKAQAKTDLAPIIQNITNNDEKAWTKVESGGQEYYLSWTTNATMWLWAHPAPTSTEDTNSDVSDSIISIGSYSKNANMLGISTFIWNNLPITITAGLIASAFLVLMKPLLTEALAWGIEYAAVRLAQAAAAAGVEELALAVPASVASVGGFVLAGALSIALFFAVLALAGVLFRKYFLTVNIYNFDPNHSWNALQYYGDNSEISNDSWRQVNIPSFKAAGQDIAPPGFNPVKLLNGVVTYLSLAFENDSTFLQGLGIAVLLGRDDDTVGLALKYVVHRLIDNELGLAAIPSKPDAYDIGRFYNDSKSWITGPSTETQVGGLQIKSSTPALGGASDNAYVYEVNLGLPPAN